MAEIVTAVIAVVGGIVAIAVILAWLKGYDEGYDDGRAQEKLNRILEIKQRIWSEDNEETNSND
jgi:hypothetical protein